MPVSSQPGVQQSGKISWFGGPRDPSAGGAPASGLGWRPGISTYNQATLRGYWLVKMPNGRQAVLQQTDIGPAPWTGRNFDFTFNALPKLGYSEGNFPTNANITATYLGKSVPAQYAHLNVSGGGSAGTGATMAASGRPGSVGFNVTVPQSVQKFDQAAYDQQHQRFVLGQFLKGQGKSAWDIGPKLKGFGGSSNPLFSSGLLPTTAPNPQDFVTTTTQLQKLAGSVPLSSHPASFGRGGYVNPIPGANLGRTDMGVDANLPAGHPIRAIGDSRVVNIYPNWYRGQPYMLLQLTSGPQAGKYYYVAEAINPTVHPGQRVGAGQMIGTYNPNGTGLELGWGTSSSRTLAQATTGYHEGQVTPAGQSFRQFLTRLH